MADKRQRSLTQAVAVWMAVFVGRRVIRHKVKHLLEDVLRVEPQPKHTARKVGIAAGVTALAAAAGAAVWFGRARD